MLSGIKLCQVSVYGYAYLIIIDLKGLIQKPASELVSVNL